MSAGRIASVGARASLGLHALQVAMGVRAGLFEPRASRFVDARGQAIGTCRVGGLGADRYGYDRMVELAIPALREAVAGQALERCVFIVSLPLAGRADDEARFDGLAQAVARRVDLDVATYVVLRRGHAGGIEALRRAGEHLADGATAVVVGGVDSYYHPEVLSRLDGELRLKALGIQDGFIPGEGAAFAVLRPDAPHDAPAVLGAALASEPAMLDEERPRIAEGLTEALLELDVHAPPWTLCDVTSDHRRMREWSLVGVRHQLARGTVTRLPSELGDLGAATVPMMVAIATTWWRQGCAPAPRALLVASSDDDTRGAAVLAHGV